jgi:hypothetical protein
METSSSIVAYSPIGVPLLVVISTYPPYALKAFFVISYLNFSSAVAKKEHLLFFLQGDGKTGGVR